jgi:DNA-binding protein YbaB
VPDDPFDGLAHLVEEGDAIVRDARSAEQVSAPPGSDTTGSVSVTLDRQGRVERVSVAAAWRQRLGTEKLPDAVVQAVRDAAIRRLGAWGAMYGDGTPDGHAADGHPGPGSVSVGAVREDFERRLQAVSARPMSGEDRRAALSELLALAEAIERGVDEVSGKLQATLDATYTGQSPDRHVTVTMTGGGDVVAVRFDRAWLRQAHEINVGRQLSAAFRAATENVAAQGVRKLIADSSLGEVHRVTQDPLGLARRLRLTD